MTPQKITATCNKIEESRTLLKTALEQLRPQLNAELSYIREEALAAQLAPDLNDLQQAVTRANSLMKRVWKIEQCL